MGEIVDRVLVIMLMSMAAMVAGRLSGTWGFLIGAFVAVLCFAYLEQRARSQAKSRAVRSDEGRYINAIQVGSIGAPLDRPRANLDFFGEADKWH